MTPSFTVYLLSNISVAVKHHLRICLRGDISAKLIFLGVEKKNQVMTVFCACEIMLCTSVYTGAMQATNPAEGELEVRKIKRYLEWILSELGFYFIGLKMFHE